MALASAPAARISDAAETIQRIKDAGITPTMITGDNQRTALAVATQVGIEEVLAEILPDEKAAQIRQLQQGLKRVMMVGDGINDAPALTQADIGVAIGAGTDIAIESADIVIMSDRLGSVIDAHQIGVSSYRKTQQNLALAFSFNGIGVTAATTGLVSPVWAMIAMISSVTAVLANSFGGQALRRQPLNTAYQALNPNDHHQPPAEPTRPDEKDSGIQNRPGILATSIDGTPSAPGSHWPQRSPRPRSRPASGGPDRSTRHHPELADQCSPVRHRGYPTGRSERVLSATAIRSVAAPTTDDRPLVRPGLPR